MRYAIAALVPVAAVACWWSYREGFDRGTAIGRAQVAAHLLRIHPAARIDLPEGIYDWAAVDPSIQSGLLYAPGAATWDPRR